MTGEFDLIAQYFKPLAMGQGGALGLTDDAAVLDIPAGHQVVISSDTLNAGAHFFVDENPKNIAKKALRVNLSDLAAMGAKPLSYQLNLALPQNLANEAWLGAFSDALLEDQKLFNVFCSGGDTTRIDGALSISITVLGVVPDGKAVKRSGAKNDDVLLVTGTIGDAYIGFQIAQKNIKDAHADYFINCLILPEPRIQAYEALRAYAHAAVDVSDGLMADLDHMCCASNVGAEVNAAAIPLSQQAQELLGKGDISFSDILVGGDDYELLIAVSPANVDILRCDLSACGISSSAIGNVSAAYSGVNLTGSDNKTIPEFKALKRTGWSHF